MRKPLIAVLGWVLLTGLCLGQDNTTAPKDSTAPQSQEPAPTGAQSNDRLRIAPGSVIPVQLTATIDAKKAKTGDEVLAKVTQDLKSVSGDVVVPKDTKMVGHVTEAQARNKEQKESQVGIQFDHAVLKDGASESLPLSIQAVIAPPNQRPEASNADSGGGVPNQSSPTASAPTAGGRPGMSSGAPQQQAPSSYPTGGDQAANSGAASQRPPITANTQGVVGLSNYSLSTPGDVTKGSVVSSEKGNVKLESGTVMLLRVNQ